MRVLAEMGLLLVLGLALAWLVGLRSDGVFIAGLLLADEVNRTPPKTQSALLEAMQERRLADAEEIERLVAVAAAVAAGLMMEALERRRQRPPIELIETPATATPAQPEATAQERRP